jgi:hypothetical protein
MKPVLIGSGTGIDLDLIATPSMVKSIRDWVKSDFKITSSYPVSSTQLVIEYDEGGVRKIVEISLAFPGDTNYEILELVNKDPVHKGSNQQFLRPESALLWMLKESHKYKDSVHFEKTRRDVLIYRSSLIGKKKLAKYAELQARREEETYRPKIKLNVSLTTGFVTFMTTTGFIRYSLLVKHQLTKLFKGIVKFFVLLTSGKLLKIRFVRIV